MKTRYENSESLLARSLEVIPLGAQTFSKSVTQLPLGISPFFVEKAVGARFWDVDGNEYLDLSNALAAVTLGYCDADVDEAVVRQMRSGVTFSLSHEIEVQVAEKLCEIIPCAEKVRFAKNGTDATSGAIRVSRAYTGRDRVAVCGYHGWQDWYIGSTSRDLGVPKGVSELTHKFDFNDVDSLVKILNKFQGEFAAIILEPMAAFYPEGNFLQHVQSLAKEHGALLIFDETVTGFRFGMGGAQELFGVTPDLATFGKGIANGYPLSALVGRSKYMEVMSDIFFSGTFGGETLSLAAAKAVIKKLEKDNVLQHMNSMGEKLSNGISELIVKKELASVLVLSGHPVWSFLIFSDHEKISSIQLKTLFMQEMFKRGVYTIGANTISYAHSETDIDFVIDVYNEVLDILKRSLYLENVSSLLECAPLEPLFKVR
jgi:glutamate-1-semialdehyde 2,1-aminomutase